MIIVYQGYFLGEGLKLLGHDVHPVRFTPDAPASVQIEAVCPKPDLVLLELFGNSLPVPPELHACPHRIAVWCIDSCINEFWLLELLQTVDDVFVDQLSSVRSLARHGIKAALASGLGDFPDLIALAGLSGRAERSGRSGLIGNALDGMIGFAELEAFQAELETLPESEIEAQPAALIFLIARVYAALGRTFYLGFLKQAPDKFPDTALELALLAWEQGDASNASAILDFMLECAETCGIAGELLPQLCLGMERGLLGERQILRTAELAEQYYDKDLALRILNALRKVRVLYPSQKVATFPKN